MSRGNARMNIFLDDVDRRKFLYVLSDVVDAYDVECCDYCLMSNHYHLGLRPHQANLSRAIQCLNGVYGLWWNARHDRVGHVFQGRFKDQIVQTDRYLSSLTRYIARNPLRAKLVSDPAQWPWSSYRSLAGHAPVPPFLTPDLVLGQFGDDERDRRTRYVRHVLLTSDDELAREEQLRSTELVLGDRAFKLEVLGRRNRVMQDGLTTPFAVLSQPSV